MYWDALAFLEPNLLDADLLPAEDVPADIQKHLTAVASNKELQRFIDVAGPRYRSLSRTIPRLKARGKPTREEIRSLGKEIPEFGRIPLSKLVKHFNEANLPERRYRRAQGVALSVRERRAVQSGLARLLSIRLQFIEICHRNLVPTMLWPVIWRQMTHDPGKDLKELVPRSLKENRHVLGMSMLGYVGVGWGGPSLFAVLLVDLKKADDKKIKKMTDRLRQQAQTRHKTGSRDTKTKRVQRAAVILLEVLRSGGGHAGMAKERRGEYVDAWNDFARTGESSSTVKWSVAVMYCWLYEDRRDMQDVYEFVSPRQIQRALKAMWTEATSRRKVRTLSDLVLQDAAVSGDEEIDVLKF